MKNLFKFGFLAFALSLSLTSCDFFGKKPKNDQLDSNKIDTAIIDSSKADSNVIDSVKTPIDSAKK